MVPEVENTLEGGGKITLVMKRQRTWRDCFHGLVLGRKVSTHDAAGFGWRCLSEKNQGAVLMKVYSKMCTLLIKTEADFRGLEILSLSLLTGGKSMFKREHKGSGCCLIEKLAAFAVCFSSTQWKYVWPGRHLEDHRLFSGARV